MDEDDLTVNDLNEIYLDFERQFSHQMTQILGYLYLTLVSLLTPYLTLPSFLTEKA